MKRHGVTSGSTISSVVIAVDLVGRGKSPDYLGDRY